MTAKLDPVWSVIPRPASWPRDLGVRLFRIKYEIPPPGKNLGLRTSKSSRSFGWWNSPQDDRAKAEPAALLRGRDQAMELPSG